MKRSGSNERPSPTPEQLEKLTAEIREGWDDREYEKRHWTTSSRVEFPFVSVRHIESEGE
jgi:hypothetical protein